MIKVYQIKDNGFLGEVKVIHPEEGVGLGWTYTAPPGEGSYKWENCAWVPAEEPAPPVDAPQQLLFTFDELARLAEQARASAGEPAAAETTIAETTIVEATTADEQQLTESGAQDQ